MKCANQGCEEKAEHRPVLEVTIAGQVAPAVFPFDRKLSLCTKHAKLLKAEDLVDQGGIDTINDSFALLDLEPPAGYAVKTVRL